MRTLIVCTALLLAGSTAFASPASVPADVTPPTIVITTPTTDPTFVTNTSVIQVAGTASDDTGVLVVQWNNSATGGSGTATGTTSWVVPAFPLAIGANVITATATDTSGNTASDTITVTYDPVVPAIFISTPTSSSTFATSASSIALGGTATDNVAVFSVTWLNATTGASGMAAGTSFWAVPAIALAAGANAITVTATDTAGNTSTRTIIVTFDATSPTIVITTPTPLPTFVSPASVIGLGGTASDNIGIASVTWLNATTGASGTAIETSFWTVPSVALAVGANAISVTATDTAGNTASDTILVTYDPVLPTITISTPTALPTFSTSSSPIALAGSASDNVALASITWFNTTTGASGTAIGTGSWAVSSVDLAAGANVITVAATDTAGNSSFDTITVTFDAVAPTITITTPTAGPTFTTTSSPITLGGTASDNIAISRVTWINVTTGTSGIATGTSSWSAVVPLVHGPNVIRVKAADAAGNTGVDQIRVVLR